MIQIAPQARKRTTAPGVVSGDRRITCGPAATTTGGENIYPREIEEFLHTLDIVAEAQVLGVPDEKFGEELLACIRLRGEAAIHPPSPAELRALCKDKIAHYKVPRYWKIVDEYPMTVTGKVQKFKLKRATGSSARTTTSEK